MPPSRTSRRSVTSYFEGFPALSAHERAQIAISHYSEATLDDAMIYFDDTIRQEVAAMGFDLSKPVKTGASAKYSTFQCRKCPMMRRPEQFWVHFFASRPTGLCATMKGSNERE